MRDVYGEQLPLSFAIALPNLPDDRRIDGCLCLLLPVVGEVVRGSLGCSRGAPRMARVD